MFGSAMLDVAIGTVFVFLAASLAVTRAFSTSASNASARPVEMMTMTAMILATGPSIDSRIDWSGASQGIEEPAALAVDTVIAAIAVAATNGLGQCAALSVDG